MDTLHGVLSKPATMASIAGNTLQQKGMLTLVATHEQDHEYMVPKLKSKYLIQLNPLEGSDHIIPLHQCIQQLSTSLQSNQALQASALIGRKVLVDNDKFTINAETQCIGIIDVPAGTETLLFTFYAKETGNFVYYFPHIQYSGLVEFCWNGVNHEGKCMPAGQYQVQVEAGQAGQQKNVKTMVAANIDSISLGKNGQDIRLIIAGMGAVLLS